MGLGVGLGCLRDLCSRVLEFVYLVWVCLFISFAVTVSVDGFVMICCYWCCFLQGFVGVLWLGICVV